VEYTPPRIFLLDENNRGIFHRFAMEQHTTMAISFAISVTNWEMNTKSCNYLLKSDNNNGHFTQ
jgi:hypothetical protein